MCQVPLLSGAARLPCTSPAAMPRPRRWSRSQLREWIPRKPNGVSVNVLYLNCTTMTSHLSASDGIFSRPPKVCELVTAYTREVLAACAPEHVHRVKVRRPYWCRGGDGPNSAHGIVRRVGWALLSPTGPGHGTSSK